MDAIRCLYFKKLQMSGWWILIITKKSILYSEVKITPKIKLIY